MPETDLANAAAVAERLRAAVAKDAFTVRSSGEGLAVTISVGVAATTAGGDHRDRLLKRADAALYCAKSAGRNRVIIRSAEV
jgi:two-component system cell cycle response regulator